MVKFTDSHGKTFAVSKYTLERIVDTGSASSPQTTLYVGGISYIVAQSIDDVIAALNA